jgi:hypothetical protein
MLRLLSTLALFTFLWLPLQAQLKFENQTNKKVWVCIVYYVESDTYEGWYSRGWWAAAAGETITPLTTLDARYYYWHAKDEDGNLWSGEHEFIMHPSELFNLKNADDESTLSSKAGLEWRGYLQMDTEEHDLYTMRMTMSVPRCVEGDCQNGQGTFKWFTESRYYTGSFVNGKRHGQGRAWYGVSSPRSGDTYVGEWQNDRIQGKGVYTFKDKTRYEGQFAEDKRNGWGTLYDAAGRALKTGMWTNDEFIGTLNNIEIVWKKGNETTTNASHRIEACIKSPQNITSCEVRLNGSLVSQERGPEIVANDGCSMTLSRNIELREGTNTVEITAINRGGAKQQSSIVITRKALPNPVVVNPPVVSGSEKRLALLVGNGNYGNAPLQNPLNDVNAMANSLKRLGFTVIKYQDLDRNAMLRAFDEFGSKLPGYDLALFFYAGHGVQVSGQNYLIPVNANLQGEADVQYECVEAGRVLAKMDGAKSKVKLMILDACRDNPWERGWNRSAAGNGLASMSAPQGTFISYSTEPGKTAPDGIGANSPFTEQLLKALAVPNLSIESVFKQVRANLSRQRPWEQSSLIGEVILNKQ